MFRPTRIIVAGSIALGLAIPNVFSTPKQRSISTSRQFLVYGSDVAVRGAICELAEKTKAHLLNLLNLHDSWKMPLVVNLEYPQANFPEAGISYLEVSQLGYGLKLQLNLVVTSDLEASEVQRELLRAILVEIVYRDRGDVPVGAPYVAPPDWLLDGVLGLQPDSDWDEKAQLLRRLVTENRIAPLDVVVRQKREQLDTASRKLYGAYSQALVQLLLDAPGGRQKLVQYIHHLPTAPNDMLADLRVHFPEILARAPEKWWALAVARLSAAGRYELLGASATAAQLDRLLRLSIPSPDGTTKEYSLGDYGQFRKFPAHRAALELVGRQLRLLGARVHPLYRPIVQEEYSVVLLLLRGKTREVPPRLNRIARSRFAVERQARAIDDYLNWYEATQLKSLSGAFTQFLKPPADNKPFRRRDPISVYLDSIEMETDP